ncbi:uncharacterized protein FA14DRAFT_170094 [Meira miltonrushii]|uniref:Ketoreductase (KR) domain-containing protein n=1 Tax=Meira miltonrushii TaxID=1280837 RepID=A0A316VI48_9BASI|nr:uncharacterized protein FA14DRAFT_170094 [Meira miltonrushii]PWN37216.1 hypothetical protein FA14DRAFT_170094 [Meira miltonrushii]
MPVFILSTYLSGLLALDTLPTLIAAFVAVIFLKQWSSGVDLVSRLDRAQRDADKGQIEGQKKKPRDLHGTVILVVGGFTAQGLLVCAQLSSLGAQLILLTPTIRSSYIMQMIHLLRDGTSNSLIYAEECDVTNLQSIEAFAAQWNLGEGTGSQIGGLGAGPAGGLSGSTGLGAASSGPGATKGDGNKSGFAPRRVDSIVFLPLDSARYSVGSPIRRSNEGLETSQAELMGRFHLVNVLLPSLLLLPPNRDIRIVTLLSPWYAAGAASLSEEHNINQIIDGIKNGKMTSPWTYDGSLSVIWLALSRELQRRIQLMTDADQRPRTKLPGIDDEGNVTGKATPTNVNLINVCAGFERGRDVLDYLLPGTGKHSIDVEEEWGTAEQINGSGQKSDQEGASDQLRDLVDPRLRNRKNVKPAKADDKNSNQGRTAAAEKLQKQLQADESTSAIRKLMTIIQYSVCIFLWPLAWLLGKSPRRAAETVTWATIAPIHLGKTFDANLNASAVVPGELHREGRVVRPALPNELLPGPSVDLVWKAVEEKAKSVLSSQREDL